MNYLKRAIFGASLISIVGCGASGLKMYWLDLVRKSNATISDVSCRMNGFSRSATCLFKAEPDEIEKIVRALELKSIDTNMAPGSFDGCIKYPEFSTQERRMVYKVKKDGSRTPYEEVSHVPLPQVQAFGESKRLPRIPGNDSSSFNDLFFNPETHQGCVDLHYPYG